MPTWSKPIRSPILSFASGRGMMSPPSTTSSMSMPKIIYGTAWKKERTTELVVEAVKAGFRGIDTACQPKHYREDLVGKALSSFFSTTPIRREDLFIQTKYTGIDGQDTSQPLPYDPKAPITEQVKQSVQRSIANLGVEYIDSVLLHSPLRTLEATLEAYRTLEEFHSQGLIRNLGISNIYDPRYLQLLIDRVRVPISVVQNRWYEGNGWDMEIVTICQNNNIRYQSFWTLTGSPSLVQQPIIAKLARERGMTPQQTIYKLCQTLGITPLCGSTTPAHVRAALEVEEKDLSGDDPDVQELMRWMGMVRTRH